MATDVGPTVFGLDPSVLVDLMLEQDGVDALAFRNMAELCRQAGALDEASRLYQRVVTIEPDDAKSTALVAILAGRPSPQPVATDVAWPSRFVRIENFLSPEVRERLWCMTTDAMSTFVASGIYRDGEGRVDPTQRVSLVLPNPVAFGALVQPYVVAAVDEFEVAAVLGIDRHELQHYELQVTYHGDGAYFKAHTDSGSDRDRSRRISFVYYFHRSPRAFSGGGLRLFDAAVEIERFAQTAFTRLEPTDNSIVFFPSNVPHEVEQVDVEGGEMSDGRFSINGWIRAGDSP